MKTFITGPRTIQLYTVVAEALTSAASCGIVPSSVISTMESGVSILGYRWATERKLPVRLVPPEWKKEGKPAALIADREAVTFADAVVTVWDGVDWRVPALLKYCRCLDPKVLIYSVTYRPLDAVPTLVKQGREDSYVVL